MKSPAFMARRVAVLVVVVGVGVGIALLGRKPPEAPTAPHMTPILFGRTITPPDPADQCRRSRESAGIWTGSLGFLRPSGFLRALGITEPVAVAFDRDDLGVVREPIDQRDGAGGVGKDRVPLLEG